MLEQKVRTSRNDADARLREDRLLEAEANQSREYHELVQRRRQRGEVGVAPPREHDERSVYPRFDQRIIDMLERWDTLDSTIFRQLAERGRDYVIKHNRFPDAKMLKRWFAELKQEHPEYEELPIDVPESICWSLSELLRQYMYQRRSNPDAVFEVERRRKNCFHLSHVRILLTPRSWRHSCDDQEIAIVLPKLGEIIVACTNCPPDEDHGQSPDDRGTLKGYLLAMNWRGETAYKMKGCRVWKSPTTQNWYITLSFQRFDDMEDNPPPGTPIRGEILCPLADVLPYLDDDETVLRIIREAFDATQAKALTAKELCQALAKRDIKITDKLLAKVLRLSPTNDYSRKITSRMTKRSGQVLWCYHREDFGYAWEVVDKLDRSRQQSEEAERQRQLKLEAEQRIKQEHDEFMRRYDAFVAEQREPPPPRVKLRSNQELAEWRPGIYTTKPLIKLRKMPFVPGSGCDSVVKEEESY
jgi:hypothetical protein